MVVHVHVSLGLQEKDKLQEELSRQRKENKATASRLTHQTEEALASKEEAAELSAKLQQMEAHRDHLLDKVGQECSVGLQMFMYMYMCTPDPY